MKRIIVIFLFAVLIQVNASDADARPEHICFGAESITAKEVGSLFKTKPIPAFEEQSNDKLKCYAACIMEQMKLIDGCSYQLEAGKEYALNSDIKEIAEAFDACKDSAKGEERCECGYRVYKCIMDYVDSLDEKKRAGS